MDQDPPHPNDMPDTTVPSPGDPARPTCGACAHKVWVSDEVIECWGVPPTPCIVGQGANLAGQRGFKAELLRPRISPATPCCAHFALGAPLPVLSGRA